MVERRRSVKEEAAAEGVRLEGGCGGGESSVSEKKDIVGHKFVVSRKMTKDLKDGDVVRRRGRWKNEGRKTRRCSFGASNFMFYVWLAVCSF